MLCFPPLEGEWSVNTKQLSIQSSSALLHRDVLLAGKGTVLVKTPSRTEGPFEPLQRHGLVSALSRVFTSTCTSTQLFCCSKYMYTYVNRVLYSLSLSYITIARIW